MRGLEDFCYGEASVRRRVAWALRLAGAWHKSVSLLGELRGIVSEAAGIVWCGAWAAAAAAPAACVAGCGRLLRLVWH